jgi:tRNA/rRNA methyltransferase
MNANFNMNGAATLDRIRIVLSRTSHPGNIGAAARAMKTMGLSRLYLVAPGDFPSDAARARSSNARDVLDAAVVCASMEEALSGTVFAAALTARRRDLAVPLRWAREGAAEIVAATGAGDVALVFGNESAGLSNEELALCRIPVTIPANPEYSSLNLGAAVQVLCYEMRMIACAPGTAALEEYLPASFEEIRQFYAHLEVAVTESGFLNPAHPKRLIPRLHRLFERAGLEKEEVSMLRGMLKAFQKSARKS